MNELSTASSECVERSQRGWSTTGGEVSSWVCLEKGCLSVVASTVLIDTIDSQKALRSAGKSSYSARLNAGTNGQSTAVPTHAGGYSGSNMMDACSHGAAGIVQMIRATRLTQLT